jgi:hypothetical protein
MIELILEMLKLDDHLGVSEAVDIAKGKYKVPETIKEVKEQKKREQAWQ